MLAIGLFASTIISCQSNQKGTPGSESDSTAVAAGKDSVSLTAANTSGNIPIAAITADTKIEVPKFSSEEVNEGFAKFEPLKQEYIAALKSKNATEIKAVNTKYIEWVKVASNWKNLLTNEENQAYIDYYTKLVTQWDAIAKKK